MSKQLDSFDNPNTKRDYTIRMRIPEFTCVCPKTGQPDFAEFHLEYVPNLQCIELKSLKLYMVTYREEGHFHEDVTNRILDDLVTACNPKYMKLTGIFNVRGGIYTDIIATHIDPSWTPPTKIELP
jgi:7-cyano-7-deazaguanine reductase